MRNKVILTMVAGLMLVTVSPALARCHHHHHWNNGYGYGNSGWGNRGWGNSGYGYGNNYNRFSGMPFTNAMWNRGPSSYGNFMGGHGYWH